jgi:hypothetical protein
LTRDFRAKNAENKKLRPDKGDKGNIGWMPLVLLRADPIFHFCRCGCLFSEPGHSLTEKNKKKSPHHVDSTAPASTYQWSSD